VKIKNLPAKETPHVNSDTKILNLKISVAEKNHHHWTKNLVRRSGRRGPRVESRKCYPLLLTTFEENKGTVDQNKLDELEAAVEGELTRAQMIKWFWNRREKLGIKKSVTIPSKKRYKPIEFPEQIKSVLLRAFAKNSGYVNGEELDELEETLELTRTQIINWFYRERLRRKCI